ncbi:MAG: Ig-like domain-containing protein, partial [Cytophagales bacterium]|nr:Ig-like domain-containing protein [Cytophagales bacterium]
MRKSLYILYLAFLLIACGEDDGEVRSRGFVITSVSIGLLDLSEDQLLENVPIDQDISISFSTEVRLEDLQAAITLRRGTEALGFTLAQSQGLGFVITPSETLRANTSHHLDISADLVSPTGASFPGASFSFKTQAVGLQLLSVTFGGKEALDQGRVTDVPRSLDLNLTFSATVDMESLSSSITIGRGVPLVLTQLDPANEVSVSVDPSLPPISRFVLSISDNLVGANGEGFPGYAQELYTEIDPTFKFPEVADEELLTLVQEQTFKYFWDFAHPTSGLARERNTSGDLVTIGGSGFGVMAILVGIERGFITRQEGVDRLETIVNFLETADRFHGAW